MDAKRERGERETRPSNGPVPAASGRAAHSREDLWVDPRGAGSPTGLSAVVWTKVLVPHAGGTRSRIWLPVGRCPSSFATALPRRTYRSTHRNPVSYQPLWPSRTVLPVPDAGAPFPAAPASPSASLIGGSASYVPGPGFASPRMCPAMAVGLVDRGSRLPARWASTKRQGNTKGDGQAGALSKPSGVPGLLVSRTAAGPDPARLRRFLVPTSSACRPRATR